jgi:hypothetical protein
MNKRRGQRQASRFVKGVFTENQNLKRGEMRE